MFKLKVKTTNAAFEDGGKEFELARILRKVADDLEDGRTSGVIFDLNGNSVGGWES